MLVIGGADSPLHAVDAMEGFGQLQLMNTIGGTDLLQLIVVGYG